MGDSLDGFFDRSHDDFFEGTGYFIDFLSVPGKTVFQSQSQFRSSQGLTASQDLANLELPRPQQYPSTIPPDSLPPMTGLMRQLEPQGFSAISPNSHFFQGTSNYSSSSSSIISPQFFTSQQQAQQTGETSQSYFLHDYSRPRGENRQISSASHSYVCQHPSPPAWQVQRVPHPQQEQLPRPDFLTGPTSSVGASHRPIPIAASTPQRSDHPSLFSEATNSLLPSFTTSTNSPHEPNLPALPRLPTPIDRRRPSASASHTNSLNLSASQHQLDSDGFLLNQLVSRDFSSPSFPSATPRPAFSFSNPLPAVDIAPSSPLRLRDPPAPSRDVRSVLGGDSDSVDSDSSRAPSHTMSSRSRRRGSGAMSLTLPSLPTTGSSSSSTPTARRSSKPPQISPAQRGGNGSAKKRKRSEEEDVKPSIFEEDDDLIDLVDKEEVPEGLRKEKQYTKLRDFTCIICYEEVTDLTVTFCGHMFCAGCLHSALTVDPARRVCPVCRQKVDKEPAHASFGPRAKGFFPLKLKLRSKKEVERRKQRCLNHDDSFI